MDETVLPARRLRVAVVQMRDGEPPAESVASALALIDAAAADGAEVVATPELTNWHGSPARHPDAALAIPGPVTDRFAESARRHSIHLLVGSVLEAGAPGGRCFNTSLLFGPDGDIVATYRKIHLFDVELAEHTERESAAIAPGGELVTATVAGRVLGLSVCYDLRFPELYRGLVDAGAEMLAAPAAFTAVTGRAHWEVLLRARAIESQCFVIAPARVGRWDGGTTYGHSAIVDPWGRILASLADEPGGHAIADLDFGELERIRRELPSLANRRLSGPEPAGARA
ncbi:MAG TPA: carbon-nitrogen hydrolase family protein [Candidatus Dormibacteraeota bacterium]|nr:carbon-nitrogen hydrolase family protein [Candidatus Dormibacteraeota bacterium]